MAVEREGNIQVRVHAVGESHCGRMNSGCTESVIEPLPGSKWLSRRGAGEGGALEKGQLNLITENRTTPTPIVPGTDQFA